MIPIRHNNDFKIILSFLNATGQTLNPVTQIFKFVYADGCGNTCEVSFDGTTRVNNYEQNGKIYATIPQNSFNQGVLTRNEYYAIPDAHFPDKIWHFGDTYQTNIEII